MRYETDIRTDTARFQKMMLMDSRWIPTSGARSVLLKRGNIRIFIVRINKYIQKVF